MGLNQLAAKSPGAELIWTFDFAAEVPAGVSVSAILTTVPAGLIKDLETPDLTNKKSAVRISGGTHGQVYLVRSVASLNNNEEVEGFLTLRVMDGAG